MNKNKLSANRIVSLLSSMKTAIVLITLLILLSILGSLIPQGREAAFYPESYGESIGNAILSTHMDNFFRSWIFLFTSGLFFINLTICSVLRLYRRIRRKASMRIGPDIIHLSLLLIIVLGIFVLFTRQETTVMIGVGDSFWFPDNTEVKLVAFDIEYYDDGRPRDWLSRVVLMDEDSQEQIIEVNKPLKYGAYSVFQSSYELKPYAIMEKDGREYEVGYKDGVPVSGGSLFLMDVQEEEDGTQGLYYFVKNMNSNEYDEVILKNGDNYKDVSITNMFVIRESGLQLVYQPGNTLILAALLLFCIGLAITFYQKIGDGLE